MRFGRSLRALVVVAVLTLVAAIAILTTSEHRSTGGSAPLSVPTGNPKGDPQAQCKVLALGALELLAREDSRVLAGLEAGHNPASQFIADVVNRNRVAFLAAALRTNPVLAKRELMPKVQADCLHAPA